MSPRPIHTAGGFCAYARFPPIPAIGSQQKIERRWV